MSENYQCDYCGALLNENGLCLNCDVPDIPAGVS